MSAALENQYALKWSYENTMDRLMFIQIQSCKPDVIYLGEALMLAAVHPNLWSYWKRKWHDNYDIIELMEAISLTFEVRIFKNALERKIHAGTAMFALKHHYKWSDRKPAPEPPAGELPPSPPRQAPTPVEEAAGTTVEPTEAECLSDNPPYNKDFRPCPTDCEIVAKWRTKAARDPRQWFNFEPPGASIKFAENLYKRL